MGERDKLGKTLILKNIATVPCATLYLVCILKYFCRSCSFVTTSVVLKKSFALNLRPTGHTHQSIKILLENIFKNQLWLNMFYDSRSKAHKSRKKQNPLDLPLFHFFLLVVDFLEWKFKLSVLVFVLLK